MVAIRTYKPGDELAQVGIYNDAAAGLPSLKPATVDELRRRILAPDFDPSQRFYAIDRDRPVAYATFAPSGRISFPWCRKGHENAAEPLLQTVLQAMKEKSMPKAWAAYRADWEPQKTFFEAHGFHHARDMVSFTVDLIDLPTPAARPSTPITKLSREDLPALLSLGAGVLRCQTVEELERYLFHNPLIDPGQIFVLRGKTENQPLAVGLVIARPEYAAADEVDPNMPCFRLGAFGTEGLTHKRINGLFSFVAQEDRNLNMLGLDLIGYALYRLASTEVESLAAQVASDVPHLHRFYRQYFRQQGSFPIFERSL